jgi:hypothetical protein
MSYICPEEQPTFRRGRKHKLGGLREGAPKPKEKIRNTQNISHGDPKWEMENAIYRHRWQEKKHSLK